MRLKRSLQALALMAMVSLATWLVVPAFGSSATLSNSTNPVSPNIYRVGDTITYKLAVANDSDEFPAVMDVVFEYPDGSQEVLADDRFFEPGEGDSYERTYVVRAQDVRNVTGGRGVVSYLSALGEELAGDTPDEIDLRVSKTSYVIDPAISIAKTVDADGDGEFSDSEVCYAGSTVTWRIVVTNSGIGALSGVTVQDSNGRSFGPLNLATGAQQTFEYTGIVNEDTVNVAGATAIDGLQQPVTPVEDSASVTVVQRPLIGIKTYVDFDGDGSFADDTESNLRGSDAAWKVVVTNDGPGTLYGVVITDTDGNVYPVFDLAPGESREFVWDDPGVDFEKVLDATASGFDAMEAPVGPVSDDAAVTIYDYFDMGITKSASATSAEPSQAVVYTVVYTNHSTTAVSDYVVSDDFDERYMAVVDAGGGTVDAGTITWTFSGAPLAPGESGTITYILKVLNSVPIGLTDVGNTVVVRLEGDQDSGNDSDDYVVKVDNPLLPYEPEPEPKPTPVIKPKPVVKAATPEVVVEEEEPFLPFTGGNAWLPWLLALGLAALGTTLRSVAAARR